MNTKTAKPATTNVYKYSDPSEWKHLVGTTIQENPLEDPENKYYGIELKYIPSALNTLHKELLMCFLFNKIPEKQIKVLNSKIREIIALEKRRVQK